MPTTLQQLAAFFAHLPKGISAAEARRLDADTCQRAGTFIVEHKSELVAEITGQIVGGR